MVVNCFSLVSEDTRVGLVETSFVGVSLPPEDRARRISCCGTQLSMVWGHADDASPGPAFVENVCSCRLRTEAREPHSCRIFWGSIVTDGTTAHQIHRRDQHVRIRCSIDVRTLQDLVLEFTGLTSAGSETQNAP